MSRERELEAALKAVMDLIGTNQLVRNTSADHSPDWLKRMVAFVGVIKQANDVLYGVKD